MDNQLQVEENQPNPVPTIESSSRIVNLDLFIKMIGVAGSFGLFLIATAYIFGYVIWNSYLGKYGVHLMDFLRPEFLSASLCFTIFLFVLGLPPTYVAIYFYFGKKLKLPTISWSMVMLWYILLVEFKRLFTPNVHIGFHFFSIESLALLLLFLIMLIYALIKNKIEDKNLKEFVDPQNLTWIVMLIYTIYEIVVSNSVQISVLISCSVIGVAGVYIVSFGLKKQWYNHKIILLIIGSICLFLTILNTAEEFGEKQFNMIPQKYGGGKPEKVKVLASAVGKNIFGALAINCDSAGWSSPIYLLAKTEKEIYFVTRVDSETSAKIVHSNVIDAFEFLP